jgi:hypothetical protein
MWDSDRSPNTRIMTISLLPPMPRVFLDYPAPVALTLLSQSVVTFDSVSET